MSKIKEMWGYLVLANGDEIDFCGQVVEELSAPVVSYDPDDLGDEANFFVKFEDGSAKAYRDLKQINSLFGIK